jgi:hypothetical protein
VLVRLEVVVPARNRNSGALDERTRRTAATMVQ